MGERYAELRRAMVDSQVRTTDVTQLRLLDALLSVPREHFVPAAMKAFAYIDDDILVADDPHPRYLMEASPFAKLLQLLDIGEDDLVLDIGCGTGYSSAVISRMAGAVIALEEDEQLAEMATNTLVEHGFDSVAVVTGALNEGFSGEGPYDVIVLNGAVDFVPQALLDQLKPGGRLGAIVGSGLAAQAILHVRDNEGVVSSRRAFNINAKPLPGFAKAAEFVF